MTKPSVAKVESGNYMENLLNKMNEPDPRDINYLERELQGLHSASKISTSTVRDIPLVHDRLY